MPYAAAVSPPRDHPAAPLPLKVTIAVVGCEGLVLVVLAGAELAHLSATRPAVALTSTAFFLICAASLVACARGLWRLSRWARSPVLVAQLIALLLAYSLWSGGFSAAAAVVCIPAIAALAALFHPASTKALFGAEEDV
jgi:hypothetical protein